MTRIALDSRTSAFMDLIAFSEGTSPNAGTQDDGYDVIVSGIGATNYFRDYSCHPFANGRQPILVAEKPTPLYSTASGRYQIILPTWRELAEQGKLTTFAPQFQDLGCLELIRQRNAVDAILAGNIAGAIEACCNVWASFPGNLYNQNPHKLDVLVAWYNQRLAQL